MIRIKKFKDEKYYITYLILEISQFYLKKKFI